LDEVGVRIYHNQASDLLASNGASIKADNGVQIPSFMIKAAIAAAPIFSQPNAGKPVMRKGVAYDEQTPSEFAQDARIPKENGADMIGGCCGTHPEFIQALSKALFGNSIAD
jgi:5-methyltetrahydrofolate--homocysteine methyltransferase